MNANLSPLMPAIKVWLTNATNKLSAVGIDSARLDAELILANILDCDRTYLHSHSEQIIYSTQLKRANLYLLKRLKRIPLAYIFGYKEFYGRNFKVSPNVLIPRPESEEIIEILREILPTTNYHLPFTTLLDIGTGSGCLGITAKLQFPHLSVTLADISQKALNIASLNAKALGADVKCLKSDLLSNIKSKPDIILANLPYVDKSWDCSPETAFEPKTALFADDNGEALIKRLIIQSTGKLSDNGYLIIECDPRQHNSLIKYAKKYSFKVLSDTPYVIAFTRI